MSKIQVVYWTQSGNTQEMAEAVGRGIEAAGKEAEVVDVSTADMDALKASSVFAMGCPAMGAEVLEEGEMEPFVEEVEGFAAGKKIALKANISPANATNKTLVWTSSNPKTATVNANGIVTMKKGSGGKKVTITAKAADGSGKKAVYTITGMKGVVKKVTISGKKTVKAGKSIKLKAKVKATKKANTRLFWKSSNQKFATVKNGKVKAKKNAKGKKVKITAMATDGSGKKKSVTIKIR